MKLSVILPQGNKLSPRFFSFCLSLYLVGPAGPHQLLAHFGQ